MKTQASYPTRADVAAYVQAQRQAPLARAGALLRGLFAKVPSADQDALCIFFPRTIHG